MRTHNIKLDDQEVTTLLECVRRDVDTHCEDPAQSFRIVILTAIRDNLDMLSVPRPWRK